MSVAQKLWIAFGLNAALLAAVVAYHMQVVRRSVATAHQLTDVSAALVLAQARQSERLARLDENAAKYGVTRDTGYMVRFNQLHSEFSAELVAVQALSLRASERSAVDSLATLWDHASNVARRFAAPAGPRSATSASALADLQQALVAVHEQSRAVGAASQETMRRQLDAVVRDSADAQRISWLAALVALLLAVITAISLRRAITTPLNALTLGTREVARGRFAHRLATQGGGEFGEVAAAFNAMTARLAELDRLKQEFVTTVSHDLKSPLASLRETNSLLLDEVPGALLESQRRVLLLQRESADRLGDMIAKLLDLSRLEARAPLALNEFDIHELVHDAAVHAGIAGRARDIRVEVTTESERPVRIRADQDRLRQLLDNLLENAIKFSPRGSVVELRVRADSAHLELSVADRGPGIGTEDSERIFERFHQTALGRSVAGRGAGLGLTICREIVTAHGGRIRATARAGGGTVFRVELPLTRAEATFVPRRRARAESGVAA